MIFVAAYLLFSVMSHAIEDQFEFLVSDDILAWGPKKKQKKKGLRIAAFMGPFYLIFLTSFGFVFVIATIIE